MVSQMRKWRIEEQAREEQADLRESVQKGELINFMDLISHHEVGKVAMDLQHKRHLSLKRIFFRITNSGA